MGSICLIFCATGHVGSAAAAYVLEYGHYDIVRLTTRRPESLQNKTMTINSKTRLEVVTCDLNSEEDIRRAFSGGVKSVFLITPDDFFDNEWLDKIRVTIQYYASAVRAAVKKGSLDRIVCLSTIGAQLLEDAGDLSVSGELEDVITDAASDRCVEVICIRPGYFFSNFRTELSEALSTGVMTTQMPEDARFPCQAPQDVGKRVGKALVQPFYPVSDAHGNSNMSKKTVIQFAFPTLYSVGDVARILQEITGKYIHLHILSESEWRSILEAAGYPPRRVQSLVEMSNCIATGRAQFDPSDGKIEKATTSLEEYLNEFVEEDVRV
ncbi:nucleoside-diphosphate sugar epimerase [Trypanosoma theileri]|uniref:Nucleoside-diphosphate sugar epimerase n=1 Tax=Trypanosoma theileri TaxID=67003 RepID=A0A1X0NK13_9TRYP|nr:nucleoside-diphosphate sugar epimerase [Trypanosoma theileri]ORC85016.1 nucleoside-diphosphate sugar epimerase [Trypanosoma theileri]